MGHFVKFKIFMKLLAICHIFSVTRKCFDCVSYILNNVSTYLTSLWLSLVNIYKENADNITGFCVSISYCPLLFLFRHSFPCLFWGDFIYFCFHTDQWLFNVTLWMAFTKSISVFQLLEECEVYPVLLSPGQIIVLLLLSENLETCCCAFMGNWVFFIQFCDFIQELWNHPINGYSISDTKTLSWACCLIPEKELLKVIGLQLMLLCYFIPVA